MAIKLERQDFGNLGTRWVIRRGVESSESVLLLSDEELRDLVSQAVIAGVLTDEDLRTLRHFVPHSPDCRCEACTEHAD